MNSILETQRLILRAPTHDDASDMYYYLSDERATKYMSFSTYETMEQVHEWIDIVAQQFNAVPQTQFNFIIVLKEINKVVGSIGIKTRDDDEMEAGWIISKDYWANGICSEAAKAVLEFAMDTLNVHRVIAHCDPINIVSSFVMENLGMRREGHFIKDHKSKKGEYHDFYLYAILNEEYQKLKSRNEIIIVTKNLILRPFIKSDFFDVHEYSSETDTFKYMNIKPNDTKATKSFLHNASSKRLLNPITNYEFAIEFNKKVVGGCGLFLNNNLDKAEIGWVLNKDYRGRGLMYQASSAVIKFAFETLKLHKIIAHCDAENIKSEAVMKKLNMKKEGFFAGERRRLDGTYADELAYGILADDYFNNQK